MIAAALALGVLIGLTLGALGGGGSILTVPALVYLLDLTPQEATTASLVIVGASAAVGTAAHARRRSTRWRSGAQLALLGVPASLLGTVLNTRVDPESLLLAFASVMVLAAIGMLLQSRGPVHAPPGEQKRRKRRVQLVAAGLLIGFLTGFLGVGGGFVVVPVLVVLLSMPMREAVGTSLLVTALNCLVALGARAGTGTYDWEVIVPFALGAVTASVVSVRIAHRLPGVALTRAFAGLLLVVAGYVTAQVLLG